MSRTSQARKRLGVAGVAVAVAGAGLPVFLATAASAAPTGSLVLNPNPGQAAAGTCQVFTVDAIGTDGAPATDTPTITVQVTENPDTVAQVISFCDPTTFANVSGADTEQDNDATAETAQAEFATTRTAPAGGTVTATTPQRATFGIRATTTGGASIRAFVDANDNNAFDAGEIQVLGSSTFTAGGTGNAAQDAASTITPSSTNSPVTAGDVATATVNVRNAAGNTLSGVVVNFRVTSGPNGPQTATDGSTTAGLQGTATTDNAGNATIQYTTNGTRTGTDTVQFFVNQTSGTTAGPDANEPTATTTIQVNPVPLAANRARNITLTPETITTVAGNSQVFVARVTGDGNVPVVNAQVTFREEGPGRFSDGSSAITVATNSSGEARVTTTSVAGESGTQVIIASIPSTGNETNEPATSTVAAGNSSDTSTQNFVASTPTPTPTQTTTPAPTATVTVTPTPTVTNTANPGLRQLVLDVQNDTITPGVQGVITITGTPNREIEVLAYSRPSTTYQVVRRVSLGQDGTAVIRILPGTNTRLFARYTGVANSDSQSVVQNVATALSLTVVRNGSRDYTFQGRILPRRAGQLITLYRVLDDGREIITSQIRTDNTGTYRIRRVFTGSGTFGFLTRTGQNLTNVAGVSNGGQARPTAIYAGPQR